MRLKTASEPA